MAATASLVGQALGKYRVLSLIGVGGMGQVYRARDERLNRDVAIKIIHPTHSADPEALPRFEQEARSLAALNHPNLLAIYDIGTQDGLPYIVSELLVGETLRKAMSRERIPYQRVIDYAVQIVRALVAAHEKSIVHRDLKPENIFLTNSGVVKILDFGLAKLVKPHDPSADSTADTDTIMHTEAGKVLGTVCYMSPEQVRGQKIDHRSDIFSFGTMLFEMLAQRRAFSGQTTADVITAVLKEHPENLSEMNRQIPPNAALVVQHCIEKRREDRFQSAKDLLFDLNLLSSLHFSSGSLAAAAAEAKSHPSNRRWMLWGGAAFVVAAAAIGLALWQSHQSKARIPSYTQLTFRRGTITSARFTSDGNTVLYSAAWNGAAIETFFIRPGTTESRSLGLPNADLLSVSSTGELAILLRKKGSFPWFNKGTLARVPVTGGTPRAIVENVQTADWSPDGANLAIVRQVGSHQRLEYPIGKVLFETSGWLTDVRISPRNDQIAFLEHGSSRDDRGWVSVVDLDGKARRLTGEYSSERGLDWSPSGDEVWFTATRSGEAFELFSVSLRGREQLRARVPTNLVIYDIAQDGTVLLSSSKYMTPIISLSPGDKTERDLSSLDQVRLTDLSDDGKTFLFQYYGEGSGPSYTSYLGSTDGSPPVRLGSGSAYALSPDGKWAITFDDKLHKTLLQPIGAGEIHILARDGFTDTSNDTWCPDSKCVVFTGQKAGEAARSYFQDIQGGSAVPFGPEGVVNPRISPDGKMVLGQQDGRFVIFGRSDHQYQEVRGLLPEDRVIRWSQNSRDLMIYRAQGTVQLIDVDPHTGARHLMREINTSELAGTIGVPRLFVSADGSAYVYSFDRNLSELYLVKDLLH